MRGRSAQSTSARGFATTEFVLGVGLLMLPVMVLVALIPRWSEARLAATTAADAGARAAALAVAAGTDPAAAGTAAAAGVLETHRVTGAIVVASSPERAVVEVEVALPAIPFFGGGGSETIDGALTDRVAGLSTTAEAVQLVDPYRAPDAP